MHCINIILPHHFHDALYDKGSYFGVSGVKKQPVIKAKHLFWVEPCVVFLGQCGEDLFGGQVRHFIHCNPEGIEPGMKFHASFMGGVHSVGEDVRGKTLGDISCDINGRGIQF